MAKKKPTEGEAKLDFSSGWNYAPAPQESTNVKLAKRYQHFINGDFVAPSTGKYFTSINPATEKPLAKVATGSKQDVNKAVRAARLAYKNVWSTMAPAER